MQELVSIVIPCYKGEKYLAEAIESCLNQTYRHLEIIVVDDASPDRCAEIAESYSKRDARLRVVRLPSNSGVAGAFNAGFSASTGLYHTRLAQDDLFDSAAIETFVGFMESNKAIGLAYSDSYFFNEQARGDLHVFKAARPEDLFHEQTNIGLCLFWRAEVWSQVGGFDSRYDMAEDYDFCRRVHQRAKLGKPDSKPLVLIRLHGNMSSLRYRPQQQLRQAEIDARYAKSTGEARRILYQGRCNAAYEHQLRGQWKQALNMYLLAIAASPLSRRGYHGLLASLLNGFKPAGASDSLLTDEFGKSHGS